MRWFKIFSMLVCFLFLSSCAETELASHVAKKVAGPSGGQSQGNFKVGNPYKVEGKWYKPQETYKFTKSGIASWYGPGFDGKRTANGEVFDKDELTAAHRTLQLPSLVRVTNLDNGRSLVVRVNDRGPFKRGRVIDVSERAAQLLGFKGMGTAKVRLDLLADESREIAMAARRGEDTIGTEVALNDMRTGARQQQVVLTAEQQGLYQPISTGGIESQPLPPAVPSHISQGQIFPDPVVTQYPVTSTNIYVQTGSFTNKDNAVRQAQALQEISTAHVKPALVQGQQFYRVRLGPIADVNQADALLARLATNGYKQSITIVE